MPTFAAPTPIPVVVDLPGGSLHVFAGDRDDIVVTVLPADPANPRDVRAAEQVRVEGGVQSVSITGPRWKQFLPTSPGTAAVTLEVPAGTDVSGTATRLHTEGLLGRIDLRISAGSARIDEATRVNLRVAAGSVSASRITGPTSLTVSAGSVRIDELNGDATVRCTTGATSVGSVTGSLDVSGALGNIDVGRLSGDLIAKTSYAGIRVDRVESGTLSLTTSYGSVEVGVPEGTGAWLDVSSRHGTVRNELRPAEGPSGDTATAQIHASTGYGDVVVRRS